MNTLGSGLFFVSDGPVVVAGVTRIVLCRNGTRRYVDYPILPIPLTMQVFRLVNTICPAPLL
jgi:hypothetical protein